MKGEYQNHERSFCKCSGAESFSARTSLGKRYLPALPMAAAHDLRGGQQRPRQRQRSHRLALYYGLARRLLDDDSPRRLSTLCFEDGKVVEDGTFSELTL